MTNKEAFERLFEISIKRLREMSQEELIEWEKKTNKILWGGFNAADSNFCPNCGADMREES